VSCFICHCAIYIDVPYVIASYIVRWIFLFHVAILRGGDRERLRARREAANVSCFIRHMKMCIRISCVAYLAARERSLQVTFRKRATNYTALLGKMTYEDVGIFSVSREIERARREAASVSCFIRHMKMYIHISCVAYLAARERSREIQSKIQSKSRGCTCVMFDMLYENVYS